MGKRRWEDEYCRCLLGRMKATRVRPENFNGPASMRKIAAIFDRLIPWQWCAECWGIAGSFQKDGTEYRVAIDLGYDLKKKFCISQGLKNLEPGDCFFELFILQGSEMVVWCMPNIALRDANKRMMETEETWVGQKMISLITDYLKEEYIKDQEKKQSKIDKLFG